ncbi:MAG TPA: hypothetical protein VMZ28_03715 [Kofleriaceae bacterium]|nr:hypothetical protein [Kofleriaceae bacterium]
MRFALALLAWLGCGTGAPASSAPSAGRVAVELTSTDAESSKDSHDTIERYRLDGGRLHWETETRGYGEDRIPRRSGDVVLDEQALVRLCDLALNLHLTEDGAVEAGPLGGPGNTHTIEAVITVDGRTGRWHAVHQRPWNGPKIEEPLRFTALDTLRDTLATLRGR